MNIGRAAEAAGVSSKMIRYYESIGLLPAPDRRASGYRDYAPADIHRLRFIRRARELGFPMARIRELMALWNDRRKGNAEIRAVASGQIAELEAQSQRLNEMVATLRHLVGSCARGQRPECPILGELSGGLDAAPPVSPRAGTRRRPLTGH